MVGDIFEDFELPSKKFLATPLQTGKISALSSINVGKNDFLMGAEVLTEKALLEKAEQFDRVDSQKEQTKTKKKTQKKQQQKWMCMMQLLNYIISCQKSI